MRRRLQKSVQFFALQCAGRTGGMAGLLAVQFSKVGCKFVLSIDHADQSGAVIRKGLLTHREGAFFMDDGPKS